MERSGLGGGNLERGGGGKGLGRKDGGEILTRMKNKIDKIVIFRRKICTDIRAYSSINIIVLNKPRNYLKKFSGKVV